MAAELLCLEAASTGSSYKDRGCWCCSGTDEAAPCIWAHTHCVYIHSSLKAPLGLVPQHL